MKILLYILTIFLHFSLFSQTENPDSSLQMKADSIPKIENQKLKLKEYYKMGYQDSKGIGSGLTAFAFCSITNFFGIYPALLLSSKPFIFKPKAFKELEKNKGKMTKKQFEAYQSGMNKKKTKAVLIGSGLGIVVNFLTVFSILK